MKKIPSILTYILSFFTFLFVWYLCSLKINASLILPSPFVVFSDLIRIIRLEAFWQNFLNTFLRVILSFVISVILGGVIGFLCGASEFFKDFFEIPLSIIRTTPVIAFILIAYFWFKTDTVPVFVSVLMTLPIIITSVKTGFENTNKDLLKMAKVYNLSKKEILKYVKIPSVIPHFLSGMVSCFGLSWKVVAAGEVICLPKYAVGTLLQRSQMHLETSEIIAQTIVLVFVSFMLEKTFSYFVRKSTRSNEI